MKRFFWGAGPLLLLLAFGLAGCRSTPEIPPLDPARKKLVDTIRNPNLEAQFADALARVDEVNFRDPETARTPLIFSVISGNPAMVDALLQKGADPNLADFKHNSPLHFSATRFDSKILDRLLEAGANADLPGPMGKTPLMEAVRFGMTENADTLILKNADIRKTDDLGRNILFFSAMASNNAESLTNKFLKLGVPRLPDSNGRPPCVAAIEAGNTNAALRFLELLGDLTVDGADQVEAMIAMKAAIDANDSEVILFLVKKSIPLNRPMSTLYVAAKKLQAHNTIKMFARNKIIAEGKTPLSWAAETDNLPVIQLLIDCGASPLCVDNAGNMPIAYAKKRETVEFLKKVMNKHRALPPPK